ncbi:MAG: hypothetical protein AB7G28_01135 [Pirellulales bacterium]
MRMRWHFERVVVYAYLICVLVVSSATLKERAQWSQTLWPLKPFLDATASLTAPAFDFAVIGILVCPFVMFILALMNRISQQTAFVGCALFAASVLLLIPAIQ